MSAPKWVGQAHAEAPGRVEKADALKTAELQIRKMVALTTRDRISKAAVREAHGGAVASNVTARPADASYPGRSAMPPDVSALAAKPTSANGGNFVSVAVTGIGLFRPGEIEHLAGFGITPSIVAGVLCLSRVQAKAAEAIVAQARGSR